MKIVVIGGSGLIGKKLVKNLRQQSLRGQTSDLTPQSGPDRRRILVREKRRGQEEEEAGSGLEQGHSLYTVVGRGLSTFKA